MEAKEVNRRIWEKFHIKKYDNLPFSPWLEDASRITLAELLGELECREGAEIGVRTGKYSLELLSRNPNLHMICVDTWAAYARVTQEKQDSFYRHCQQRLAGYKADLMRMASMDAVGKIENNTLDFVYIDGRHEFDYVMLDLICWAAKVKSGGIIAGHDYYHFYQGGVIQAVNAYTLAHNIQQWYITKELQPSFFWVKP